MPCGCLIKAHGDFTSACKIVFTHSLVHVFLVRQFPRASGRGGSKTSGTCLGGVGCVHQNWPHWGAAVPPAAPPPRPRRARGATCTLPTLPTRGRGLALPGVRVPGARASRRLPLPLESNPDSQGHGLAWARVMADEEGPCDLALASLTAFPSFHLGFISGR